ncbi:hypothetical protein ACOME3_009704 [Neoechinorhynchus agilis]
MSLAICRYIYGPLSNGSALRRLERLDKNWASGKYKLSRIECHSDQSKGVYCLQYDDEKIVSGLRDKTVKVWKRGREEDTGLNTAYYDYSLTGHTGSVLCLQYCGDYLVTGSSDATVRIWSLSEQRHLLTIFHHSEAVLHVRFNGKRLVSGSKDRSIATFELNFDTHDFIQDTHSLHGHHAAVNVVDFDDRFIVSASGDRTIRVWDAKSLECSRTLLGHRRGIACFQFRGDLIVSGSSDNTIRIWSVLSGVCLRSLEGHTDLVRCIRFDHRRIISGAYDGIMKVWDIEKALNTDTPYDDEQCCLISNQIHAGRIFRVQFDHKLIISGAHDDSIAFIDFDH